jgi:CHAT domain-containing protein
MVHASIAERSKALEHFRQALSLSRAVGNRSLEATTLYGIARVERDDGNLIEARAKMNAALEIVESLRSKIARQELRTSYFASQQNFYQFYTDLLMGLRHKRPSEGHDAVALEISERARARSLLDALAEARADIRQGVAPALLEREQALQRQLNVKAERLTNLLNDKRTEEQASVVRKQLDSLLTEYQQLQAQIRISSPRYTALTQPVPLNLKEIQQQVLDQDSLLLEYSLGEKRSFLWAVTPTSITSYVLPKRAEIDSAARRVYEPLTARNQHPAGESPEQRAARVEKADAEYAISAAALSQMLLAPVASQLGRKRLIMISEGALQYVPFAALPAPKSLETGVRDLQSVKENNFRLRSQDSRLLTPDSRLPLIAEHEIVTLPSASVLAVLRREIKGRTAAAKAVAVLADPVFRGDDPRINEAQAQRREAAMMTDVAAMPRLREPASQNTASQDSVERSAKESGVMEFKRLRFSRQEAEAITALAPGEKSLKAIDFAANRVTATSLELGRYRVLHFATHGLLNSQHPELSGIVLSLVDERGRPQDGFLRLHEIYNLRLGADLVVLSACQTALGREVKGEGLVGLTRGFMYAGAPRVVASLWNVDDRATAELMKRFYGAMFTQGMRPAAALRAAQTSLRREKGWAAPYYWAGFTLQGEWK